MSRKRALVAIGAGYGNIVMATPTIVAVWSMGYSVDVFVDSHLRDAATLLTGWDCVSSIYLSRESLLRTERQGGYDAIIRTRWNSGAQLGLGPEFEPEPLPVAETHEALLNMSAVRRLGFAGPMPDTHVETDMPFVPLPRRFVTIAPGYGGISRDDWTRKAWPHWPEFCDRCHEATGMDLFILGADHDVEQWMDSESRPWLHNLCAHTSIRSAGAVISKSAFLVALDNGLAHVGAAVGRPVVALFGATSEVKNRPLGRRVRVVTADIDCRPCQMTSRWDVCANWQCMREIQVEDVLKETESWSANRCMTSAVN